MLLRLLDTSTFEFHQYDQITHSPPYATLSYRWQNERINFRDLCNPAVHNLNTVSHIPSLSTIFRACSEARAWGIGKLWADSVCIDRSSSAELSEAINSMFEIYKNAQVCFAYLSDVTAHGGQPDDGRKERNNLGNELIDMKNEEEDARNQLDDLGKYIERSKWRKRIWMLQELIASKDVQFYDTQWRRIGSKNSLLSSLSSLLQIDMAVLKDSECLPDFSIGRKMSWAAQLSADRPEDVAYSLLGIFGVSMSIIYGEGQRAFLRLQEEILKDTVDATLLAWQSIGNQQYRGLLANSPAEFYHFAARSPSTSLRIHGNIQITSAGILIDSAFGVCNEGLDILLCLLEQSPQEDGRIGLGIPLREWDNRFVRSSPYLMLNLSQLPKGSPRRVCMSRSVTPRTSSTIARELSPPSEPLNELAQFMKGAPRRKRDVTGTPQTNGCVPVTGQINPTEWIKPGRYTLQQDVRSGQIAVSIKLKAGEPSVFLGTMVPLEPLPGSRLVHRQVAQASRAKTRLNSDQEGRGRRSQNMTVCTTDPLNSSELEEGNVDSFSSSSEECPILGANNALAKFADELTEYGIGHFARWMASADATAMASEPKEALAHLARKRMKAECFEEYTEVQCSTDSEDVETVIVGTARMRTTPLACHFQLRSPTQYTSCLKEGGFSSIRNLTRHLSQAHRLPYYCPICGQIFQNAGACDDHIRKSICDLKPEAKIEGVSDYQMKKIRQCIDPSQSKEEQWYSVWKTVFHETEKPLVPYASSHAEIFIRILRDYWKKDGQDVILAFLKSKGLETNDACRSGEDMMALSHMVLKQMVDELLQLCT